MVMGSIKRRDFCGYLSALASGGVAVSAAAQDAYPSRPIVLIAPAAPGGLTDILARAVAEALAKRLNAPVVVDNKEGAGGIPAMGALARAKPDGYSLILAFPGPVTVAPALHASLPYDPLRDFTVIGPISVHYQALVVGSTTSFKSAQDVIDLARQQPGKLSYGTAGVGTSSHLAAEIFQQQAGIKLNHIPYKGEAPALRDVAGGTLDMAFATLVATKPVADSGRVRVIGLGAAHRAAAAPELPTFAETGLPGYSVPAWYGLMTNSKAPAAAVETLRRESAAILKDPAFRARLAQMSIEPWDMNAAQAEQFMRSETSRWKNVVRTANIKVD
jgi:tripartite-type tricarboxylate transporter receptor subunit TctC